MKKYFLLATVAGCLLSANAMAGEFKNGVAKIGVSATFEYVPYLEIRDMDFGKFYSNQMTFSNDTAIAEFAGGKLTILSDKVYSHTGGNAGMIASDNVVSGSTGADIGGLTFNFGTTTTGTTTTADLKCGDVKVAEVRNLSVQGTSYFGGADTDAYYINGTLYMLNGTNLVSSCANNNWDSPVNLTGVITATLIY